MHLTTEPQNTQVRENVISVDDLGKSTWATDMEEETPPPLDFLSFFSFPSKFQSELVPQLHQNCRQKCECCASACSRSQRVRVT